MNEFMRRVGKFVIAGVLGLAVPSAALAQQPTVQNLGPIPPAMPVNVQPAPLAPTPPAMPASPVPVLPAQATLPNPPLATQPQVGNPALQPGVLPNAYPIQPGGAGSFGISDGLPTRIQTPTQPQPLLSSQPPPFQVTPDTPAATNDPNSPEVFPLKKSTSMRVLRFQSRAVIGVSVSNPKRVYRGVSTVFWPRPCGIGMAEVTKLSVLAIGRTS